MTSVQSPMLRFVNLVWIFLGTVMLSEYKVLNMLFANVTSCDLALKAT